MDNTVNKKEIVNKMAAKTGLYKKDIREMLFAFQEVIQETMQDTKVILDGGTGTGKTYFVLNILGKYAEQQRKSILYLCNRSALKGQTEHDVLSMKLKETVTNGIT